LPAGRHRSRMDLNYLLIWIAGSSAVVNLIRMRNLPAHSTLGWKIVSIAIIAVLGTLHFAAPELAGYAAGTLWALLILIPSIGSRYLMRFVMREQYEN